MQLPDHVLIHKYECSFTRSYVGLCVLMQALCRVHACQRMCACAFASVYVYICVFMCVCMCACSSVYLYALLRECVFACVYISVCACACVCRFACVCVHKYKRAGMHMRYMCVCVCARVGSCMCMWTSCDRVASGLMKGGMFPRYQ